MAEVVLSPRRAAIHGRHGQPGDRTRTYPPAAKKRKKTKIVDWSLSQPVFSWYNLFRCVENTPRSSLARIVPACHQALEPDLSRVPSTPGRQTLGRHDRPVFACRAGNDVAVLAYSQAPVIAFHRDEHPDQQHPGQRDLKRLELQPGLGDPNTPKPPIGGNFPGPLPFPTASQFSLDQSPTRFPFWTSAPGTLENHLTTPSTTDIFNTANTHRLGRPSPPEEPPALFDDLTAPGSGIETVHPYYPEKHELPGEPGHRDSSISGRERHQLLRDFPAAAAPTLAFMHSTAGPPRKFLLRLVARTRMRPCSRLGAYETP